MLEIEVMCFTFPCSNLEDVLKSTQQFFFGFQNGVSVEQWWLRISQNTL